MGLDQVHLQVIAQDGSLGRGRIMQAEADGQPAVVEEYVQELPDRTSGVRTVVETGQPLVAPFARDRDDLRTTTSSAATSGPAYSSP